MVDYIRLVLPEVVADAAYPTPEERIFQSKVSKESKRTGK